MLVSSLLALGNASALLTANDRCMMSQHCAVVQTVCDAVHSGAGAASSAASSRAHRQELQLAGQVASSIVSQGQRIDQLFLEALHAGGEGEQVGGPLPVSDV